jgi:hypothetical protein
MDIQPDSLAWLSLAPAGLDEPAVPAASPDAGDWFHGADGGLRIGLSMPAPGSSDVASLARQVLTHLLD